MSSTASVPTTTSGSRWRVRRLAGSVAALATGTSPAGDRWALVVRRTARSVRTQLQITTAEGLLCPPVAVASLPLQVGGVISVFGGRELTGPAWLVLRLSSQVHAVRVQLSDGSCQDLSLIADDDRSPARLAVLVYSRHLDVHRIDPYGIDGSCLDDLR